MTRCTGGSGVECPIDGDECERAHSPNERKCQAECLKGLNYMETTLGLKALRPKSNRNGQKKGPDQHGVYWWAKDRKCSCPPCLAAKAERMRERRRILAESRPLNDEPRWTHGTRYAWDRMHCDCEICVAHKVEYVRNKNRKARERARVLCGTNRAETVESIGQEHTDAGTVRV